MSFLYYLSYLLNHRIKVYLSFFIFFFKNFRLVTFQNQFTQHLLLVTNFFLVFLVYLIFDVIIQDSFLINQSIKILITLSRWSRNFNVHFAKIINLMAVELKNYLNFILL